MGTYNVCIVGADGLVDTYRDQASSYQAVFRTAVRRAGLARRGAVGTEASITVRRIS